MAETLIGDLAPAAFWSTFRGKGPAHYYRQTLPRVFVSICAGVSANRESLTPQIVTRRCKRCERKLESATARKGK